MDASQAPPAAGEWCWHWERKIWKTWGVVGKFICQTNRRQKNEVLHSNSLAETQSIEIPQNSKSIINNRWGNNRKLKKRGGTQQVEKQKTENQMLAKFRLKRCSSTSELQRELGHSHSGPGKYGSGTESRSVARRNPRIQTFSPITTEHKAGGEDPLQWPVGQKPLSQGSSECPHVSSTQEKGHAAGERLAYHG